MTGIIIFPQKAISTLFNMTRSSTYLDDFEELKKENIELKNEISKLKIQIADYDLLKSENKLYKEKNNIDSEFKNYNIITAEIISFSPNNFERVYTINKGSNDGIKEKMTVITKDGLVGYISKVSNNTSNITSIIDASTLFSVRNVNTKDLFVASGMMSLMDDQELMGKEIPFDSSFSSGDIIETSGVGSLYPKGIAVGKIKSINMDKNPLEATAIIESMVDFNKLEIVAVIIKEEV